MAGSDRPRRVAVGGVQVARATSGPRPEKRPKKPPPGFWVRSSGSTEGSKLTHPDPDPAIASMTATTSSRRPGSNSR